MIAHQEGGLCARALLVLVALVLLLPLGEPQAEQVGLQIPPSETRPEVGFLAPDFTLEDLNGRPVRLSEYRGKRVVLLYFWTTLCQACEFEMHSLEIVYRRLKGQGLDVIAVYVGRGRAETLKRVVSMFTGIHALTFSTLLDPKQEVMDRYGITLIPTLFFIDRDGRIQGKYIGPREWRNAANWKLIERLLSQN